MLGRLVAMVKPALGPLVRRLRPTRVDLPLSTWGLVRGPDGALSLDGVLLDALLDRYGSPLHVVDAGRLDRNAADFLAVPPGAKRGCQIAYSFKTNPVPGVLRRLLERGIGAEVISEYELWLALELGFAPGDIVFNGPARSRESLRVAVEREIGLIHLNSRCEIAPLVELARGLGRRPRVGVRVVPPGGWSGQLGERVDNGAAMRAFEEAVRAPELRVVALHAHLGGEIASAERLTTFVAHVLAFADELHRHLGLDIEVLDLGGSLACPTVRSLHGIEARLNRTFGADLLPRTPDSVLSIRDAVALVVAMVTEHYRLAGRELPRIVLEPGRAMTGDTQMLLTRVVNVQDEVDGLTHAVLDAGVCIASPLPHEVHQIFPIGRARSAGTGNEGRRQASERRLTAGTTFSHADGGARERRRYRLTGPICSPADVLCASWDLPELLPGDGLAIMDSGAYFVPFASSFSFPQPAIVMIDDGRAAVLREAETFQDMTSLDDLVSHERARDPGEAPPTRPGVGPPDAFRGR